MSVSALAVCVGGRADVALVQFRSETPRWQAAPRADRQPRAHARGWKGGATGQLEPGAQRYWDRLRPRRSVVLTQVPVLKRQLALGAKVKRHRVKVKLPFRPKPPSQRPSTRAEPGRYTDSATGGNGCVCAVQHAGGQWRGQREVNFRAPAADALTATGRHALIQPAGAS